MAKYGKWIGAGLGFVMGGPLGALLGLFIGSTFDNITNAATPTGDNPASPNNGRGDFMFSLLVLATAMMKADGRIITKRRYMLPCGPYTIELDVFLGELAPLVIAEVEFPDLEAAESFSPPDWFGQDVTMDPSYHNSFLSRA